MPNDLITIIKAKQAEITKLQTELDEARALLAGEQSAESAPKRAVTLRATKGGRRLKLRRGRSRRKTGEAAGAEVLPADSAGAWAAQAIRDAGHPLHAKDLVKAIEHDGHKVKFATVVGAVSRWCQKELVFYRAGRNTFGLIEMRKT